MAKVPCLSASKTAATAPVDVEHALILHIKIGISHAPNHAAHLEPVFEKCGAEGFMIPKMPGVKHDRAALFMGLQHSLKASAMQLYVRILCLELLGKHIFREGAAGIVEHLIGNLQFSHLGISG